MLLLRADPGLSPGWIAPPYRDVERAPDLAALAARRLAPGTLLVLDVTRAREDWLALPAAVSTLRSRFPNAPVVLRVATLTPEAVRLAQRVATLRVRALFAVDEPPYEALRPLLTQPGNLGDDVVEWLALRGIAPSPLSAALLRHVVSRASDFPRVSDCLGAISESDRTARHRFRQEGLPPPSAWHQMARALHSALRIQAEPEMAILRLALDLGYGDQSGLSRQVTRAFGFTPAAVRGTLGWEWLVHRWLGRARAAASNV
jgi:AraC-like DNA-binding protein